MKKTWLDVYKGRLLGIPWYSVAGNHDWYNNITAQVDNYWSRNNRFFLPSLLYVRTLVFGPEKLNNLRNFGVHTSEAVENRLNWMKENLAFQGGAKWVFVVGHHPLIGDYAKNRYMQRLLSLFEHYRVNAYFGGHSHVLEYQHPRPSSPIAIFTSGAGSQSSGGCNGKDWGMPEGTLGFLYIKITSNSDEMSLNLWTQLLTKLIKGKSIVLQFITFKRDKGN